MSCNFGRRATRLGPNQREHAMLFAMVQQGLFFFWFTLLCPDGLGRLTMSCSSGTSHLCYFRIGRMAKYGLHSGRRLSGLFRVEYSPLNGNMFWEAGMFLFL